MSLVFKKIEPNHISVVPFYANKLWQIGATTVSDLTDPNTGVVDSDISMSIYYGRYQSASWVNTASEETTTNDKYSRTIWNSVNTLYYDRFQDAPMQYFPQGNVGVETRQITEQIQVFSIPQKIIGTGIQRGSFELTAGDFYFFDDGNGNILGYNTSFTSNLIASSAFNPNLKDFYYCSYLFDNGYTVSGKLASFTEPNYGNLGHSVHYNLDSTLGVAAPVRGPYNIPATINNVYVYDSYNGSSGLGNFASTYYLDYNLNTKFTGSAYVRIPHSNELNFDTNDDFTICFFISKPPYTFTAGVTSASLGSASGSIELISKYGRSMKHKYPVGNDTVYVLSNGELAPDVIEDTISTDAKYPYKIELINTGYQNAGKIRFSRSDGVTTQSYVSSNTITTSTNWNFVMCRVSSSTLEVMTNSATKGPQSASCLGSTKNDSDIFIGCRGDLITTSNVPLSASFPADGTSQFAGKLGPVHFFDRALTNEEVSNIRNTSYGIGDPAYRWGIYNNRYGNIIYNQGQIIWTNGRSYISGLSMTPDIFNGPAISFDSMKFRSTKKITSTEVICTVPAGELNMTTNPSVLVTKKGTCNPGIGSAETGLQNSDGECYSFVTGSDFSPYITSIGLYNDAGELLVAGKFAYPIKKPTNCDISFVVRWDD